MVVFIAIELEQEVKEKIHEYVREVVKPACRGEDGWTKTITT